LPDTIAVEHFNAIAGLDHHKDVRLLITVGRTQPEPAAHEADAGALSGLEPVKAAIRDNGAPWFDKVARGIRMRDGTGRAVECDKHPDPLTEACRSQVCEAELVQAIGRGRGVNRTAADPLDVHILADVCLPITVDEVAEWSAEGVNAADEMAAEGVILKSPADMARAFPALWKNPKAARDWLDKRPERFLSTYPYEKLSNKEKATQICPAPRWLEIAYRPPGRGQQTRRAAFDPAAVPDPRRWLEERLGPLTHYEAPEIETATPPRAEPADVADWLNGRFDEATERSPDPAPKRPPEPPARPASPYRLLRLCCRPSPGRFACVPCEPTSLALAHLRVRGGVAGRTEEQRRGQANRTAQPLSPTVITRPLAASSRAFGWVSIPDLGGRVRNNPGAECRTTGQPFSFNSGDKKG
jgi:putative DNA primase/helicase